MNTDVGRLRRLGATPLAVGLLAAVCVGVVSYAALRTLIAGGVAR